MDTRAVSAIAAAAIARSGYSSVLHEQNFDRPAVWPRSVYMTWGYIIGRELQLSTYDRLRYLTVEEQKIFNKALLRSSAVRHGVKRV